MISILLKLLESYANEQFLDEEDFLSIFQNATSIANAEEYYRTLYQSSSSSWNIRDKHMFETLETILSLRQESTKIAVWAHNSHIGNAFATESRVYGEFNLGQLCKEKYGEKAYLLGFGTHKGTVAAASYWGGDMEVKEVKASHLSSVERLFHDTKIFSFFLPFQKEIKDLLMIQLPLRAIGVIYTPESELKSHYSSSILSCQFDEFVWIDHTHALNPFSYKSFIDTDDTYPFGV